MAFSSIVQLTGCAAPLWEAVLTADMTDRGVSREKSWGKMEKLWLQMKATVAAYEPDTRSPSGLVGGEGAQVLGGASRLCDPLLKEIIATALKTGECNACMQRIVAAPTAGASGVMPAVLIPLQRRDGFSDEAMVQALFVAAGFGQVIAHRASISGAEGGCQAEIGSASAMAAAALVQLCRGSTKQMAEAVAMAITNLMGLVCDPVAGLVEVPCVKRNVIGAMNALSAAEMALCGCTMPIPCDEVLDAMRAVGDALPETLRETGRGGLAVTPTGERIAQEFL
jgi:L-serine dehydratase, iron-sulfur-dependent, alpha subunit